MRQINRFSSIWLGLMFAGGLLATGIVGSQITWAGEAADLVVLNAVVRTGEDTEPSAEVQPTAVAVASGRIVAIGSDSDIASWVVAGQTRVIDARGRCLVPGFIESHGHLVGLGSLLMELDLTQARSWEEVVAAVQKRAEELPAGQWIVGRGWHQSLWDQPPQPNVEGYPVHDALSRVSPKHPVFLMHRSGHASLANAEAMRLAKVTSATKDPSGGEILRDAGSQPIGIFRETASGLIQAAYQASRENMTRAETESELEQQILLAQQKCFEVGVTTFVDAGIAPELAKFYLQLAERGKLRLPIWIMLRASNARLDQAIPELKAQWPAEQWLLTLGGVKQMADGALGSHGAWLLEPYEDLPESRGLVVTPLDTIQGAADVCYRHDLQLCVHAIGDRANREVLNLYEPFVKEARAEGRELRWRVEHAQHLSNDDIPRFAQLGVIASMQANHATSDGPFVPDRIGQRRAAEGAYVWRKLLEQGTVIANGTDTPVEPVEPLACIWSSVTRRCRDGSEFYPGQAMTREEALRSYTRDAAFAIKQESQRGTIKLGKQADLVLLSGDPLTVDVDEIPGLGVDLTVVGGNVVFEQE